MVNAVLANLADLNGRNYVRKANPASKYWLSFYVTKMNEMITKYGENFFLIVHGDKDVETDYFVIPYAQVKNLFVKENTTGISDDAKDANTRTPRWLGNIDNKRLRITHNEGRVDLTAYYGNQSLLLKAIGRLSEDTPSSSYLGSDDADTTQYDPESVSDGRSRAIRTITQRRGQKAFRDSLLAVYGRKCAITGCNVADVLEAAHITPYLGPDTNHVANGILLRADLHTLLDCRLLAIDPATNKVMLAPAIREVADYRELHGQRLRQASPISAGPSPKALEQAKLACDWLRDAN